MPVPTWLAKRFDRCGIGRAGAVLPITIACGASAQMATAAYRRGDPVSAARRAALANAAALLSTCFHGAPLVLPYPSGGACNYP